MGAILTVAGKEFRDGLRDRWVLAITAVFALLALGLAYFGAAASGTVGFTSLASTIASLASLAIFLIPLIALLLAYDGIVGERERGTLVLLLAYPLGRAQLLLGKFLGHGLILAVSTVLGFGLAAAAIAGLGGADPVALARAFGRFAGTAILLGWVFVALAYVISVTASDKSRAAGLALVVWFWFVLVHDLLLLGLLVLSGGDLQAGWLSAALLLNPADVFRLANVTGFQAAAAETGLAAVAAGPLFQPAVLTGVLMLWVVLPLGAAVALFRRDQP